MERAIYSLFHIDVLNLIKTTAILTKEFHIPPSEVFAMPYWEYELWLDAIQALVKEQNEKQEEEAKKYNIDKYKNPPKMQQPKMPNWSPPSMGSMKY